MYTDIQQIKMGGLVNMSDVKVSIIVPIYNAEVFLSKSIESLQKQTLKDIEIILINDGSTDRSLEICKKYGVKDSRIKIIDKPNAGVSAARNSGLEIATGKYIGFLDADDWAEPIMYLNMYENMEKFQSNVCITNYISSNKIIKLNFDNQLLNKDEILQKLIPNLLAPSDLDSNGYTIMGSVWRLLINRSFLEKTDITFKEDLKYKEDKVFCLELFLKSKVISVDHNAYYHYVINSNSLTQTYSKDIAQRSMIVSNYIKKILENENVLEMYKPSLDISYASTAIALLANNFNKKNDETFKLKINKIKNICRDPKLKKILKSLDIKKYTTRKKFVIKAIIKERTLILYLYYTFYNLVIN